MNIVFEGILLGQIHATVWILIKTTVLSSDSESILWFTCMLRSSKVVGKFHLIKQLLNPQFTTIVEITKTKDGNYQVVSFSTWNILHITMSIGNPTTL